MMFPRPSIAISSSSRASVSVVEPRPITTHGNSSLFRTWPTKSRYAPGFLAVGSVGKEDDVDASAWLAFINSFSSGNKRFINENSAPFALNPQTPWRLMGLRIVDRGPSIESHAGAESDSDSRRTESPGVSRAYTFGRSQVWQGPSWFAPPTRFDRHRPQTGPRAIAIATRDLAMLPPRISMLNRQHFVEWDCLKYPPTPKAAGVPPVSIRSTTQVFHETVPAAPS